MVFDDCGDSDIANQHAYIVLDRTSKLNISGCPETRSFIAGKEFFIVYLFKNMLAFILEIIKR